MSKMFSALEVFHPLRLLFVLYINDWLNIDEKFVTDAKLGVSVEKVVATIENPNNHQGMLLPDKKNSEVFFPALFETTIPIIKTIVKNPMMRE